MNLFISGINGWVARALADRCRDLGHCLRGSTRLGEGPGLVRIAEISGQTDWTRAVAGCDVVVHLAARVHVMNDPAVNPLSVYREVNTAGTLNFARQAVAAGVRRFVFVSSIKVNGEQTELGRPFRYDDPPAPSDPYGISKREAEDGLWEIAAATGLEVVVVRPPLVYGPGVRANFAALVRALGAGLPLPLASVTQNRRSLVSIDNLVSLLVTCLDHPAAAGRTFLVSDGEDLSTAELLRRLGLAMGKPARLLPFPRTLVRLIGRAVGKGAAVERLLSNLQVDISATSEVLGWHPPHSVDEGLSRVAPKG